MKIECRGITEENKQVLGLPNDPFYEEWRIIPVFDGEQWSYKKEIFPADRVMEHRFPDENYDFNNMGDNFHGIAVYADGVCAGFALMNEEWNKWLYLDNLLVTGKYRRQGLGTELIKACMGLAKKLGKLGIGLVCQNNNSGAIEFYFKNGFTIGGVNMRAYEGTKYSDMADLYLFKHIDGQATFPPKLVDRMKTEAQQVE